MTPFGATKLDKAFSLSELMVTIGIISLLASVGISTTQESLTLTKVRLTMVSVKEFSKYVDLQRNIEGGWRAEQEINGDLPAHSWGGAIRFRPFDFDGDGVDESAVFVLDDDRPGTGHSDNQGQIPIDALRMIDELYDDGDFSTGLIVGNGNRLQDGTNIVPGELAIFFE